MVWTVYPIHVCLAFGNVLSASWAVVRGLEGGAEEALVEVEGRVQGAERTLVASASSQ